MKILSYHELNSESISSSTAFGLETSTINSLLEGMIDGTIDVMRVLTSQLVVLRKYIAILRKEYSSHWKSPQYTWSDTAPQFPDQEDKKEKHKDTTVKVWSMIRNIK